MKIGMDPLEIRRRNLIPDDAHPSQGPSGIKFEKLSHHETLAHLDTGADIATVRDKIVFANAYLGAAPIAEALAQGADIVITGRVADAALSLGPLMHELGWRWDDWEKLAQGLTVGHLLECSGQATGGNFGSAGEWAKAAGLATGARLT